MRHFVDFFNSLKYLLQLQIATFCTLSASSFRKTVCFGLRRIRARALLHRSSQVAQLLRTIYEMAFGTALVRGGRTIGSARQVGVEQTMEEVFAGFTPHGESPGHVCA